MDSNYVQRAFLRKRGATVDLVSGKDAGVYRSAKEASLDSYFEVAMVHGNFDGECTNQY